MACSGCKKKKELEQLPSVDISPESILKILDELTKQSEVDASTKEENLIELNKTIYKPFPSVDELRLLDKYFGAKNKATMYSEANRIYRMIFNEDIVPDGCRGCESRSWRKWINWKSNDILL